MSEIDTSADAVARKANWLNAYAETSPDASAAVEAVLHSTAATLRALVAERDAALAVEVAAADRMVAMANQHEADRDRLATKVAELEGALREMWDSACTNATSTPSKAAFLKARAALAGSARDDR